MRTIVFTGLLATALVLSACDEPDGPGNMRASQIKAPQSEMMMADVAPRAMMATASVGGSGPRMEVGRDYSVEVTKGTVNAALEADRAQCLKLHCVITAVSSAENIHYPTASLQALVPQAQADDFHAHIMDGGDRVIARYQEHSANREQGYQDIQSRLERLEFMKKRLYQLADQKSKKVGDLLQVERELMRVETDIDRLTRQKKGIEKVTDNVTFSLSYKLRPPKAGDLNFSPFQSLWSDSINMLFKGVRLTVLWIARWLPAVLLGGLVIWLWRRRSHTD